MSPIPHIEGVLSADEVVQTAESIASLQLDTGMIEALFTFNNVHYIPSKKSNLFVF